MDTFFWIVICSLPILPNLWCIWHASRRRFPGDNEQANWVRAGTFAPVLGGILYLCVGMRRAMPLLSGEVADTDKTRPAEIHEITDHDNRK